MKIKKIVTALVIYQIIFSFIMMVVLPKLSEKAQVLLEKGDYLKLFLWSNLYVLIPTLTFLIFSVWQIKKQRSERSDFVKS